MSDDTSVPQYPDFDYEAPDFSEVLAELREQQGWNDNTLLMLALEFIRDEHKEDDFLEMLRAQAADENSSTS